MTAPAVASLPLRRQFQTVIGETPPDLIRNSPQTSSAGNLTAEKVRVSAKPGVARSQRNWVFVGNDDMERQLANQLVALKVLTSQVAMHLTNEWRQGFFSQLDFLMSPDNWEEVDPIPGIASFNTALRLVIHMGHIKRPGLGFTPEGHIILAWTAGDDRLTIECFPGDDVRWVVSHTVQGEREASAGKAKAARVPALLAPYGPEKWLALQ